MPHDGDKKTGVRGQQNQRESSRVGVGGYGTARGREYSDVVDLRRSIAGWGLERLGG